MNGDFINTALFRTFPALKVCENDILSACDLLISCYRNEGKLLVCGNGGSCSDAGHIVGELMKSFEAKRPVSKELSEELMRISPERGEQLAAKLEVGLPAISLNAHEGLLSAVLNDIGGDFVFAQQVVGYGNKGDVLIAISSSGNSQNVLDATVVARAKGLKTIGLTGESGGKLKEYCDITICVPATSTAVVQEFHLPVYHFLCKSVEQNIFNSEN